MASVRPFLWGRVLLLALVHFGGAFQISFTGATPVQAGHSCESLRAAFLTSSPPNGVYYLFLNATGGVYRGYCNMSSSPASLVTASGQQRNAPASSCALLARYFSTENLASRWVYVNGSVVQRSCANYGRTPTNPGSSCDDIASTNASAVSGTYHITLAGVVYPVYCFMNASYGWTLVAMMSTSNNNVWNTNASSWTTTNFFNESITDIDTNADMKHPAFSQLPISQLMALMGPPPLASLAQMIYPIPSVRSTLELFTSTTALFGDGLYGSLNRTTFNTNMARAINATTMATMALRQPFCNRIGINVNGDTDAHNSTAVCRIGIIMNNENQCASTDSLYGIGCSMFNCVQCVVPQVNAGLISVYQFVATIRTRAFILVR